MRTFKMAEPRTVEELTALLAEATEPVSLMAGGTDLLDELKSGVVATGLVVDMDKIPGLAGIEGDEDGLWIGAMTRVVDLAEPGPGNSGVVSDFPSLNQAALSLATPQLRNAGTVGGNLCQRPRCWYYRDPEVVCRKKGGLNCYAYQGRNKYHAIFGGSGCFIVYPSDLAPALISLGAQATIATPKGDKVVPLEAFYAGPEVDVTRENVLAKGQFLKGVWVPAPKRGRKAAYVKLKERGTWDFALVSAAVAGVVEGGAFKEITVVMGGVAPVPWRLRKAEDALRGRPVSEALVREAAEAELKDAAPLKENGYKTDLVFAVLKKAVMAAAGAA
ncbi:MAG TPA: xanthine dehydrogenase family protein subunit M [Acidobacteriota bacterium]|nr:xanthine dehydrogenase family protein subunit M [Acidobacteriota bacterium]